MRPLLILLALCSTSVAGDCRPARLVQGGYAAYSQSFLLKQVYVPQYYQVGQAVQHEAIAEAAASRAIAKLETRIAELLKRAQAAEPAAIPAEPPLPTEPQPDATIQTAVQALVNQRCISCHSATNPKAGLNLTDLAAVSDMACLIWARVDLGTMPPSPHEPLSNADTAKFRLWMATQLEGDAQ